MPHGLSRYAEIINGNKKSIVWRDGTVSLYVDGRFESSAQIPKGGSLKHDGVAMGKGACA
jgi:hypothetical protein